MGNEMGIKRLRRTPRSPLPTISSHAVTFIRSASLSCRATSICAIRLASTASCLATSAVRRESSDPSSLSTPTDTLVARCHRSTISCVPRCCFLRVSSAPKSRMVPVALLTMPALNMRSVVTLFAVSDWRVGG